MPNGERTWDEMTGTWQEATRPWTIADLEAAHPTISAAEATYETIGDLEAGRAKQDA